MINSDVIDYRRLTDPELAAVIAELRKEKGWTQETLAEIARVSPRTIQRLESGQPSSIDTRRTLAAAFDFDDLDTFNGPWPLPNIERLKEESARIERETVAVDVQQMVKGKQLRKLAARAHSFLITSIDDPTDNVEALLASLQDCFCEYGDCHDLYSARDKLEVDRQFQEQIDELRMQGIGIVAGCRRARMRLKSSQSSDASFFLDIVYVVSASLDALPQIVRVPRNDSFGF